MTPSPMLIIPEDIVARIDLIMRELELLRQQLSKVEPYQYPRPSLAEAQALVKELRGKYSTGHSLTQALLDERRKEREREEARSRRHAPSA